MIIQKNITTRLAMRDKCMDNITRCFSVNYRYTRFYQLNNTGRLGTYF